MKITAIDPFSLKEDRIRPTVPREKPLVPPLNESQLIPVEKEEGENRLFKIIEMAQQRAKNRENFRDHKRRKVFQAYTLVLKDGQTLHEKGRRLDTRV